MSLSTILVNKIAQGMKDAKRQNQNNISTEVRVNNIKAHLKLIPLNSLFNIKKQNIHKLHA